MGKKEWEQGGCIPSRRNFYWIELLANKLPIASICIKDLEPIAFDFVIDTASRC